MQMMSSFFFTNGFMQTIQLFSSVSKLLDLKPSPLIASRSGRTLGYRIGLADRIDVGLLEQILMPFLDVSRDVTLVLALVTTVRTHEVGLFATLNVDVPQ